MTIELSQLLASVRRWWPLLLVVPLLGGVAGFVAAALLSPRFEATASITLTPSREPGEMVFDDVEAGRQLAATYAHLATSAPVLAAASAALEPAVPVAVLHDAVAAQVVGELPLIEITASMPAPERAAGVANAVAEALVKRIRIDAADRIAPARAEVAKQLDATRQTLAETEGEIRALAAEMDPRDGAAQVRMDELNQQAAQLRSRVESLSGTLAILEQRMASSVTNASVWAPAAVPADPVAPRRLLLMVLGVLAGMLLAAGWIVVGALIRRPVRLVGAVQTQT